MAKKLNSGLAKKLGLDGDWDEYQINCINPTPNDVNFNLFDPLVVQQTNVPNTPYGYIQPPILSGGSPISSIPTNPCYPDLLNTFTYSSPPSLSGGENNTLAFDSSTNKLFSSNYNGVTNRIDIITFKSPTQNFLTSTLTVPTLNPFDLVVSMAVSSTSNRLGVLTRRGLLTIIETSSFTILSTISLSSLSATSAHYKIAWNSINNTFYITSSTLIQYAIKIVDVVLQTEVGSITTPPLSNPYGLSFVPSTNSMLVTYTNFDPFNPSYISQIAQIDCSTNTISILINNTITQFITSVFYNPISNLVTYGSVSNFGIRSFDYTTLNFSSVVISAKLNGGDVYTPNNTLYLLTNTSVVAPPPFNIITDIYALDGYDLSTKNITPVSNNEVVGLDIAFYPPANQIWINCGQAIPVKSGLYYFLSNNCPPPVFYITGSAEYNDSIRDFFNSPAWTRRIYIYSKNRKNLGQVIQHIYRDANGMECNIPIIPRLSVDVNQFQNWIAQIDFPNDSAVFGINQFFQNLFIEKFSEITFIMIYKQIEKVKLLTVGRQMEGETVCDSFASCPLKVREWSEKDLELNDQTTILPFRQNMFLGLKEEAVRPFDFSMLHTYQIEDNCKDKCDT